MEGPPQNILGFILSELNNQVELNQRNLQETPPEKTSKEFIESLKERGFTFSATW